MFEDEKIKFRYFLKKHLPTREQLQTHKYLRIFGKFIDSPNLWHIHSGSVSRAFACGLFSGFMPIPFQTLLVAILAIIFRANLAIAVILIWFSNPLTGAPIFYFAYKIGTRILNTPVYGLKFELSWAWFHTQFLHIWKPLLIGSIACGLITALIGYLTVRIIYWFYLNKRR